MPSELCSISEVGFLLHGCLRACPRKRVGGPSVTLPLYFCDINAMQRSLCWHRSGSNMVGFAGCQVPLLSGHLIICFCFPWFIPYTSPGTCELGYAHLHARVHTAAHPPTATDKAMPPTTAAGSTRRFKLPDLCRQPRPLPPLQLVRTGAQH